MWKLYKWSKLHLRINIPAQTHLWTPTLEWSKFKRTSIHNKASCKLLCFQPGIAVCLTYVYIRSNDFLINVYCPGTVRNLWTLAYKHSRLMSCSSYTFSLSWKVVGRLFCVALLFWGSSVETECKSVISNEMSNSFTSKVSWTEAARSCMLFIIISYKVLT
jgi:hypothetical protein